MVYKDLTHSDGIMYILQICPDPDMVEHYTAAW